MSNLKGIRSDIWYKIVNHQPVDLVCTKESGMSGTVSAVLLGKQIIVTLAAALDGKYVDISTPIGFRVINAYSIRTNGTTSLWSIENGTAAITDVVTMGADKAINIIGTIDDGNHTFARGDDDLQIKIATSACTGIIVIDIEPTIA